MLFFPHVCLVIFHCVLQVVFGKLFVGLFWDLGYYFPLERFPHVCYECIGALAIQAYLNPISRTNTLQSWAMNTQSSLLLLRCSLLRSQPKGHCWEGSANHLHRSWIPTFVPLATWDCQKCWSASQPPHPAPIKTLNVRISFSGLLLLDLETVVCSVALCLFDTLKMIFNIFCLASLVILNRRVGPIA